MKTNRKKLKNQREMIDTKLVPFLGLRDAMPQNGWLKTVRTALGLTTAQLAKKIGTQAPGINQFENNEITKKATLGSLDRAARAMNCQLVWAIVPEPGYASLSEIVEYRARKMAEKIVKTVDQTMNLEAQGIHSEVSAKKIIELTMDLIRDGDPRIWEPMDGETND